MKKPTVFVNKIDHRLNNNEEFFASFKERSEKPENSFNVRKKIKDIFDSPRYVYKADTIIKTKKGTIEKAIVGMNKNELLTLDNEKIKIDDILDINLKN